MFTSLLIIIGLSTTGHSKYIEQSGTALSTTTITAKTKGDVIDKCFDFSTRKDTSVTPDGTLTYSFYSPRYPRLYTGNLECIRLIEAPIQHFIVLDFRDVFSVEHPSNNGCEYDFLEIHDGPFGFSPLIGKFCGHSIPKAIVSRSRYLWMRFVSDHAIEYDGFQADYHFINHTERLVLNASWIMEKPVQTVAEMCFTQYQVEDWSEGSVLSIVPAYVTGNAALLQLPIDCVFELRVTNADARLFLRLEELVVPGEISCTKRFIEVYDRTTSESQRRRFLCSADTTPSYKSASNRILFRVYSMNLEYLPRFFASYTVFHESPCDLTQYDCGDHSCINSSLVCNGRINCDHHSDELRCKTGISSNATPEKSYESASARRTRELKLHLLVVALISASLSCLAVTCAIFKYKRRRKRIYEYKAVLCRRTSTLTNSSCESAAVCAKESSNQGEVSLLSKSQVTSTSVDSKLSRQNDEKGTNQVKSENAKDSHFKNKSKFRTLPARSSNHKLYTAAADSAAKRDPTTTCKYAPTARTMSDSPPEVSEGIQYNSLKNATAGRSRSYPRPPPPPLVPPPPPPPLARRGASSDELSPTAPRSISLSSLLKGNYRRTMSRSQSQNCENGSWMLGGDQSPPYSLAYDSSGYATFLQKLKHDNSWHMW